MLLSARKKLYAAIILAAGLIVVASLIRSTTLPSPQNPETTGDKEPVSVSPQPPIGAPHRFDQPVDVAELNQTYQRTGQLSLDEEQDNQDLKEVEKILTQATEENQPIVGDPETIVRLRTYGNTFISILKIVETPRNQELERGLQLGSSEDSRKQAIATYRKVATDLGNLFADPLVAEEHERIVANYHSYTDNLTKYLLETDYLATNAMADHLRSVQRDLVEIGKIMRQEGVTFHKEEGGFIFIGISGEGGRFTQPPN